MATKKNPLAALLSSDKRQQAEDFTRDHITRSAVRQAGTYRVGVQQPLPMSQTSLGRMASSLGQVSGILNQFSEYQSKKEKAELQGDQLKHQITMQGFASERADHDITIAQETGKQLHATVAKQNEQIDLQNQKTADIEYDNERARETPEQRDAHLARVAEDVELTKKALASAERAAVTGGVADFTHAPWFDKRARQNAGAALAEPYRQYYAKEMAAKLRGLPDHERAAYLKGPEAQEMTEQILTQFMEENGLDPDDEIGDGFLSSVHNFNEVQMPATSSQLMAKSRELAKTQLTTVISSYAEEHASALAAGKSPKAIQDMPWYIDLLAMDSETQADVLFNPTTGVFAQMNRTLKGALGAELIFDSLADTLTLGVGPDGKPLLMREDGRFLGWQADIDDAITRAEVRESAQGESALKVARKLATELNDRLAPPQSQLEITERMMGVITPDSTPASARLAFIERNPEYADVMNMVADEHIFGFIGDVTREMRAIQADVSKRTDHNIANWASNMALGDTAPGLGVVLAEVFGDMTTAAIGNKDQAAKDDKPRQFLQAFAGGNAVAGGIVAGKLTARTVIEFNEESGGLLTDYRNKLNALESKIKNGLGEDYTNEEFQLQFEAGAMKIQDDLKAGIVNFARRSMAERDEYMLAVNRTNENYEEYLTKKGLAASIPLNADDIAAYARANITTTPKELQELGLKYGKLNPAITPLDLSRLRPKSGEDAKMNILAYGAAEALRQEQVNAYMTPEGKLFQASASLVSKLASRGLGIGQSVHGGLFFDGERNLYHKQVAGASAAHAERYKVSVPLKDFIHMSGQYEHSNPAHSEKGNWGPITVPGSDTWLNAAESWTKRPAYHTPTMNEAAWMQGEGYSPAGSTDRTTFPYATFKTAVNGLDVIRDHDWQYIEKPISLDQRFFKDHTPPVIGIPFEGQPNADNLHMLIDRLGVTPEAFRGMYTFYGYKDGLSWAQDQYDNSWYTNKRAIE